MKKQVLLAIALCWSMFVFGQDQIILKSGKRFDNCKIIKEDSVSVYFSYQVFDTEVKTYSSKNLVKSINYSYLSGFQNENNLFHDIQPIDVLSFGLGVGFDYGGLGANMLLYPQKNIGIFAGAGYALIGIGVNAGCKLRVAKNEKMNPYFIAMYGYQTAIIIKDGEQYNKFFYGTTVGVGLDFKPSRKGYFTMALLVPFRGQEVQDYLNNLKNNHGVTFKNDIIPVGISIGYRFTIDTNKSKVMTK